MKEVIDAINNNHEKQEMSKSENDVFEMITNKDVLARTVRYNDGMKEVDIDTFLIKDITNDHLLTKF